jgi:hypothetical protein
LGRRYRGLNKIFDFFDVDESGEIDDYEFICGLGVLTVSPVEERLSSIFTIYDEDGSQICEPAELELLIHTILMIGSRKEIPSKALASKIAELKKTFLIEKDYVTLDQFCMMCSSDSELSNALFKIGVFGKSEIAQTHHRRGPDTKKSAGSQRKRWRKMSKKIKAASDKPKEKALGIFEEEEVGGGDQFMAVKPWEGAVRNSVPSSYKPSQADSDCPNSVLKLEYVHGIRVHDTRNNIFYNPEGCLVYHTAQVGHPTRSQAPTLSSSSSMPPTTSFRWILATIFLPQETSETSRFWPSGTTSYDEEPLCGHWLPEERDRYGQHLERSRSFWRPAALIQKTRSPSSTSKSSSTERRQSSQDLLIPRSYCTPDQGAEGNPARYEIRHGPQDRDRHFQN